MAYIGKTPSSGEIIILDIIENGFNGSTTAFNLTRTIQGQTTAFCNWNKWYWNATRYWSCHCCS